MKIKNLFTIFLILVVLTCSFVVPTSAKESVEYNTNVEIIINGEVSSETKVKIEKYFANGKPAIDGAASTYGLTCTLFGHKLENTSVTTITHKVRTTAPRCLKEIHAYSACTRCDYETSQVVATEYIYCCA